MTTLASKGLCTVGVQACIGHAHSVCICLNSVANLVPTLVVALPAPTAPLLNLARRKAVQWQIEAAPTAPVGRDLVHAKKPNTLKGVRALANSLFDPGREGFLSGEIDWDTAVIKVALVRSYTFSAAHKFVSEVTGAGGTLVATSAALAGKTVTTGVADANDVTFTAVASGAAISAIIIFQSSAVTGGADVAATSQRLIAYIDTGTGLPVTPNGGDITVTWDNGANKIFKL